MCITGRGSAASPTFKDSMDKMLGSLVLKIVILTMFAFELVVSLVHGVIRIGIYLGAIMAKFSGVVIYRIYGARE